MNTAEIRLRWFWTVSRGNLRSLHTPWYHPAPTVCASSLWQRVSAISQWAATLSSLLHRATSIKYEISPSTAQQWAFSWTRSDSFQPSLCWDSHGLPPWLCAKQHQACRLLQTPHQRQNKSLLPLSLPLSLHLLFLQLCHNKFTGICWDGYTRGRSGFTIKLSSLLAWQVELCATNWANQFYFANNTHINLRKTSQHKLTRLYI